MTTPYHADERATLYVGDVLDVLRSDVLGYDHRLGYAPPLVPDESVHAVVTDPPYGLEFMGKEWDRPGGRGGASINTADDVERWNNAYSKARVTYHRGAEAMREFQAWCGEWAAECWRVLKPGGHLLAFGGSRTYHRLACAVEDSGFDVRDSIAWLYGSGFPKNMDVGKAVDRIDRVGPMRARALTFTAWMRSTGITARQINEATGTNMGGHYLTDQAQPSVATADLFDKLRPLLPEVPDEIEELVRSRTIESENLARRPVVGKHDTPAHAAEWRAAYQGGTVAEPGAITLPYSDDAKAWHGWGTALKPAFEPIVVARKPFRGTVAGNVLEHGTGALNVDGCRVGDEAGRWPSNVVLDVDQALELDQQTGVLKSGANPTRRSSETYGDFAGQETCDPARGADQGGASRFFLVCEPDPLDELTARFYYTAKAPTDERVRVDGTAHPTVKPLALMRWLVRLITPPGGTVLEPFAGSGTTVEACVVEGFRCVAIEREADYAPLVVQRVNRRRDPVKAVKGAGDDLGLFALLDEGEAS